MILISLCALVALISMELQRWRSRRGIKILQNYQHHINKFVEYANILAESEETPDGAMALVEFISRKMVDKRAARHFLWALLRNRTELAQAPSGVIFEEVLAFRSAHPPLGRVLSQAMASGMLAMTYNGGVFGTLFRILVLFDARYHEDRTRDLVASFRQVETTQAA